MSNPQASPGLPPPAPSPDLAEIVEMIESLRDGADRIAQSDNVEELRTLWRGKAIAYDTVLPRLRRLLAAPPAPSGSPAPADTKGWCVRVTRWNDLVVSISERELAGKDIEPADAELIRHCARHLLAFIGDPEPSSIPRPALEALRDRWKALSEYLVDHLEPELAQVYAACAGELDTLLQRHSPEVG